MPDRLIQTGLVFIPVGAVIIDPLGNVLFANPAFRRLTGWSDQAIIGKNISNIISLSNIPPMLSLQQIPLRYF